MSKISFTGSSLLADNMYHGKHYAFYHHPDRINDEPLLYKNLVSSATRSVEIWDPYFNDNDTEIFSHLKDNVQAKVLIFYSKEMFRSRTTQLKLLTTIKLSGKSGVKVRFGCVDRGNATYKEWEWHDRWLIIDEKQVFLVGASISSHIKPNHTTGVYELQEDEDKELVKEMFKKYWHSAVVGCKLEEEIII